MFGIASCSQDTDQVDLSEEKLYLETKSKSLKTNDEFYDINPLTSDSTIILFGVDGEKIETGKPVLLTGIIHSIDSFETPNIIKSLAIEDIPNVSGNPNGLKSSEAFESRKVNFDSLENVNFIQDDYELISEKGDTLITGKPVPFVGKKSLLSPPIGLRASPMRQKINSPAGVRYLGPEQGLSSPYVLDVFNDSKGNLWFANWISGLTKYDGTTLWHYGAESGLIGTNVRSLTEDIHGNLWLGTWGEGISKFDGKEFTHFGVEEGLAHSTIWKIFADSKGNIWFSETYSGLSKFDGKNLIHFSPKEGLGSINVRSIIEDKEGTIWIGSMGGGVSKIENDKVVPVLTKNTGLLSNDVRSIFFDSQNNLWIGTNLGLSMFDGFQIHNVSSSKGDNFINIQGITEDPNGNLWFGSEKFGVTKYDGEYFSFIGEEQGLTDQEIWSISTDEVGNIWLGTNDGVNHIYSCSFEHFTEQRGLPNGVVWSIMADSKNQIWMGLTGFGVAIYNGESVKVINTELGLPGSKVTQLYETKNGDIWMGLGRNGAIKYRNDLFTHYNSKNGFTDADIWDITEDKNGDLWFATDGKGIYQFNGNSFIQYSEENGFPSNYVYRIYEDVKGDLWIGTWGAGVIHYDFESFTTYTEREGLSSNRICDISQSSDGSYWFVSEDRGLIKLQNDTLSYFTVEQGLSSNAGAAIIIDQNDDIWVSSSDGLSLISKKNNLYNVKQFKNQDGLNSIGFLTGAVTKDSENQIWWGTGKGVVKISPNHNKSNQVGPSVSLTEIEINEKTYNFNQACNKDSIDFSYELSPAYYNYPKNLKLPYKLNHLTFNFSAIDWTAPHKIKFSHRIKDLNPVWSKPSRETSVDYRNIPYGKHTFCVRAINENSNWSEPFEFLFEISPPWWHTLWARTLYIIVGLILIYLLIQLRTAKLKKKQVELEHKIELATHEITEQHNEIMDSIAYAKRIQNAILPPQRIVKEYLKESFILYKPKDVVAGDFYWMEQKNGTTLFAAADCTGHGVPGAMVSVVCNGALNRSVREFNLNNPGEVLNKARELVISEFEKSDEEVKDGMDIALCALNGRSLKYAGANNPLWIVRNSEIIEIKADKQPIGKFEKAKPFTTHAFTLESGDTIYIFSDGFVDQFGGQKGKKFKSKAFRELLISIQNLSLSEQKTIIDDTFENWRGSIEQIDDVCVIGVRVE